MTDPRAAKIAALLAKAEGTDNEAERDTFTAAAEKLMLKWGIDEAMAAAAAEGKNGAKVAAKMTRQSIKWGDTYYTAWQVLASYIKLGMGGVMVVHHGNHMISVLGTEGDVARYVTLFDSVKNQAEKAVAEWWKTYQKTGWEQVSDRLLRRQFILSFAAAVGQRLEAERTEVEKEATGAELVLVNREKAVEEYMHFEFPNLKNARNTKLQGGSMEARRAGRAAGQRASLGGKKAVTK